MVEEIITIRLPLNLGLGSVNCYLIKTNSGQILIDTGYHNARSILEKELSRLGCRPGKLHLIILTHGDFDHSANAPYLRRKLGAKIAMQRADSGMVEHGDLFSSRKRFNVVVRKLGSLFFRLPERFTPDVYLEDGDRLSEYGLEATVIGIPGHSPGSIAVLTARGSLFCGDLFAVRDKPVLNSIMDDLVAAGKSIGLLKGLDIETVYPGHGKPFPKAALPAS